MTARELMKIVQSEYMRRMRFSARIDNIVSQIIVVCLLPCLSITCI